MNSYYEKRYEQIKYPYTKEKGLFGLLNDPRFSELLLKQQIKEHKDQPINTSSPSFTAANYEMIAYTKAALWMKKLETLLGTNTFDNAMREYYANWKFKHPNKMAFKQSIERVANKNLDSLFTLLDKTGFIEKEKSKPISLLAHFINQYLSPQRLHTLILMEL
jgi:aminopeptidase N